MKVTKFEKEIKVNAKNVTWTFFLKIQTANKNTTDGSTLFLL